MKTSNTIKSIGRFRKTKTKVYHSKLNEFNVCNKPTKNIKCKKNSNLNNDRIGEPKSLNDLYNTQFFKNIKELCKETKY